jgi:hypothetical protein
MRKGANVVDPQEVAKILATLDAMAAEEHRLEEHLLALTRREHYWLIGMMQAVAALVTLCSVVIAGPGSHAWWLYGIPNGVMLVVTIVLPWPFRVDRAAKTRRGVS